MLKKVKEKKAEVQKNWHDKFAEFKKEVRTRRDKRFPKQQMEIALPILPKKPESSKEKPFSTERILLFRLIGLAMIAVAYFLFNTLSYVYMIIAAFIISLAMEGVITFWQRLTRSRGVGILIAYLLLILFLLSGFLIIVPFMLNW
ncbi:MAG: hypothetical protein LBH96_05340 [Candidatus Peribacteria bacterium]|jgi:hypothetical protein|nr:hypothetical protein [Candidatus Peribacteria bacterium]